MLLVQASVLLTFWVDPGPPPPEGRLWQQVWALFHRPSFYPLVALVCFAPPATWAAWTVPGRHRTWLAVGWALFLGLLIGFHGHRVAVMLRLLGQQATGSASADSLAPW